MKNRTRRFLAVSILLVSFLAFGCGTMDIDETKKNEGGRNGTESVRLPEDFRFSMVWDVYGISSYDSETGKLVKTTDAKVPENYITTLKLEEDELTWIYGLISSLELRKYPEQYDPFNDPESTSKVMAYPSQTWELEVFVKGEEYTISCPNIAPGLSGGYDDRAKAFVEVFRQIRDFLMETEEWKALPEYEVFYK